MSENAARKLEIELGPLAADDAERAFRWYLERNPDYAVQWYDGLTDAIASLEHHPQRCAKAPEARRFRRDIRHLLYSEGEPVYRILFVIRAANSTVHVLRIRHGAQRTLRGGEVDFEE